MKQRTEAQIIEEIQHEGDEITAAQACAEVDAPRNVVYMERYAGNFVFTKKGGRYVTSRAEFERWKAQRWYREVKKRPVNHVNNYKETVLKLNKEGVGPLSIAVRIGVDARDVIELLIANKRIRGGLYAHRSEWEEAAEDAKIDF